MVLRKISFSSETKRIILDRQDWKCAICNTKENNLSIHWFIPGIEMCNKENV